MKNTPETDLSFPRLGVIEALSLGYNQLLRFWEVLLVPIILDLFFWLGPQMSFRETLRAIVRQLPPETATLFRQMQGVSPTELVNSLPDVNMLTILTQVPGGPLPLTATLGGLPRPIGWDVPSWAPTSWVGLMGVLVVLPLLGTPIAGIYQGLASRPLFESGRWGTRALWTGLQLFLLVVVLILLVGLSILVSSVLLAFSYMIHPGLMGFGLVLLLGAGTGAMVMGTLLFYFTPASIVLYGDHAGIALVRSARVVTANLGSSMGFILLTLLISHGFAYIWMALATTFAGILVSILGNAVLTAGLTIGGLYFFHNRHQLLRMAQEKTHRSETQGGR